MFKPRLCCLAVLPLQSANPLMSNRRQATLNPWGSNTSGRKPCLPHSKPGFRVNSTFRLSTSIPVSNSHLPYSRAAGNRRAIRRENGGSRSAPMVQARLLYPALFQSYQNWLSGSSAQAQQTAHGETSDQFNKLRQHEQQVRACKTSVWRSLSGSSRRGRLRRSVRFDPLRRLPVEIAQSPAGWRESEQAGSLRTPTSYAPPARRSPNATQDARDFVRGH